MRLLWAALSTEGSNGRLHAFWCLGYRTTFKLIRLSSFPMPVPVKSPLPTGTDVLTRQTDWRRFAVGCGMRLVKSAVETKDLDPERWSHLANLLRANKGGLGDLVVA